MVQTVFSDLELFQDRSLSSIESGFEKFWHSVLSSSPFFFMASLFVLFDIELILLIPCILLMNSLYFYINMLLLIIVVTVTLILE